MVMKFSLVLCTFNPRQEWLDRAVNSADGLFDEIIIVNDGSTNGVMPDAWFSSKMTPMKVIKHDVNKGLWAARNTGIKETTGDVIVLLDDDDYFDRDGVVKLKEHIEKSLADIWHFHLQQFNEVHDIYGIGADPSALTSHSSIPGCSWYRKKVWSILSGYRNVNAEDWDFLLRAYRANFKFDYFPHVVLNYNRRRGSRSSNWGGKNFDEIRKEILG
jgi:glycosyltransferase involved in cell wall biosynthesis